MIGLIIKDFYCMKQIGRALAVGLIMWAVIFLPQKDGALGLISLSMLIGVMQISNISSYDHQAQWDAYTLSMPLSRTNMVQEKYILALLIMAICGCLSVAVVGGAEMVRSGRLSVEWMVKTAATLSMGTGLSLIYAATFLPLSMWLGVEKARYFPTVLFILVFFAILFITKTHTLWNIQMDDIAAFCTLTVILSLALFVISFFISISIYRKKDF